MTRLLPYALFLSLLLAAVPLDAQIKSGTIDYNERFFFELGDWMPADRKKEMEARMANGDFDRKGRLQFTTDAFSYSQLQEEPKPGQERNFWMRNQENPDIFFTSVKDSMVTDRRRVLDRAFIMEDKWVAPKWNIAARKIGMKEIPLPNQLATAISIEGDTLTAYFTESIPLGIGPRGYGGLPGAIVYLKVQKDGRSTEYKMIGMQPNAPNLDMTKPADEEIITREEFEKHMKRATEMMERRRRGWERG
ncbi:GLPGLI family protein [Neolewinella lacunae]|uniref:GLPGLI family protein n=1 Tax=Neolewinella lacunae TaxID=1517758 RepID=A0A923T995_9BACT|nr:GLPGLI family protein [Neolewinella lacunae]MBC6996490.1 GLPGLI family protein [Neolewinella lacunae]MDN3636643.1 GLPGLI family protein [Neolewinella lacunae]